MNNVNINVWGSAFTQLDNLNTRTGASDLTDIDYTNFPPFVRNNLSSIGDIGNPAPSYFENDAIYIGYLNSHGMGAPWETGADIDKSVAYCACINTELTIYNTIVIGTGKYDSIISDDYNFIIPNQDKAIAAQRKGGIVPIFFKNGETYFRHKPNKGIYPMNGRPYLPFYNPASSTKPTQKMYMWTPDGLIDDTSGYSTSSERAKVNNNAYCSYWRDFGIRSLFGVIRVIYFDGTYSQTDGTPQNVVQNPVSLHWYETQTDVWKTGHPILGAFVDLYFRRNTDGTYTSTKPANMCFVAEISNGLELVNIDKWGDNVGAKVWQPAQSLRDACNSFFPLFGDEQLGARVDTAITGTVQIGTQLTTSGNNGVSQTGGCLVGYQKKSWLHSGQRYSGTSMLPYKTMWLEMEGTAENLELLRKSAAAYGIFFADDEYNLADAGRDVSRWTDSNMCLGVVDSNGFTDGTYTRGTDNTTANNWTWKTASESKYDPDRPPPSPENEYSTETTFNSIGDVATMTKRYVLTGATVKLLAQQLWTITENMITVGGNIDFSELSNKLLDQFLTSNPIDCIVSLQRYPMEIPAVGDTTIVLGKYDTSLHAKPMEKTAFFYLFNGNTINPKFGDSFLDYQPFTKMELYVPFCGTIQINPADILGRKLNVQLVVDFTTGTATGFVMSDNLVIETVNGNIAIDIPVTGIQQTTVASNLYNAIAQRSNAYKQEDITGWNRVSLGGALEMFWGDAMGASDTFGIKGKKTLQREIAATNREKADYDLTHQSAPIHIIGSASPAGGWAIDLNCRLLIYYPTGDVIRDANPPQWDNLQLARYGRTTGFACCVEKAIGEMGSGLVVGTAPRLDLMTTNTLHNPATIEELDMIRAAIEEGVILPTITE